MNVQGLMTTMPRPVADDKQGDKQLKAACRDMEAVFLNILLSRMRATVPKNDLTNSHAQEISQSLLDSELTKTMAQAGSTGLADVLYSQLAVMRPVTPAKPTQE